MGSLTSRTRTPASCIFCWASSGVMVLKVVMAGSEQADKAQKAMRKVAQRMKRVMSVRQKKTESPIVEDGAVNKGTQMGKPRLRKENLGSELVPRV